MSMSCLNEFRPLLSGLISRRKRAYKWLSKPHRKQSAEWLCSENISFSWYKLSFRCCWSRILCRTQKYLVIKLFVLSTYQSKLKDCVVCVSSQFKVTPQIVRHFEVRSIENSQVVDFKLLQSKSGDSVIWQFKSYAANTSLLFQFKCWLKFLLRHVSDCYWCDYKSRTDRF